MEDIESIEIQAESGGDQPVLVFGVPLRFQNPKLILRELSRFVAVSAAALTMLSSLLAYMANNMVTMNTALVLCSFLIFVQHVLVYANLISNGWGTQKGKFWCEVKIMIARGFNSIRTSLRLLITPLLFTVMSVELGIKDPVTVLFLVMLVIISEIYASTSENQNQYNLPTKDKFVDSENQLLLEDLHVFQKGNVLEKTAWAPLIMYAVIQFVVSMALISSARNSIRLVPSIILFYNGLQMIMAGLHLFGSWSFVQLEIYRSLAELCLIILSTVAMNM